MGCTAKVVGVGLGVMAACAPLPVGAQATSDPIVRTVALQVEETAGIRRNFYPVNVRVPFAQGELEHSDQIRLMEVADNEELAVQATVASRWTDGSIQWLQVDSNVSLGPEETLALRLEYGRSVSAGASRGLVVNEELDTVQIGRVRFGKTASPLVRSVAYRDEVITSGSNGFVVTDVDGIRYDLGGAGVAFEMVRGGPVYAELRYTGRVALRGGATVPFVVTVEMPNSKSWVKAVAVVEDPNNYLRALTFHSPLSLGSYPWVWDFGTDRWTYGVLRNEDSSVVLTNEVSVEGEARWWVDTGASGQERPYETTGSTSPLLPGWGHLQGETEVVAFAVDRFAAAAGTYGISFSGSGQMAFEVAPAGAVIRHELTVYQHFVSKPVQIGAATSPPSMLQPLVVRVDRQRYAASGVPAPLAH
ncbi:MAG: hypothetical protein VX453_09340 [Acidobacteriota bacterium]|nr:hypothetical protein [Acidobacteriota bacterium]